jgi:hypothetical protein
MKKLHYILLSILAISMVACVDNDDENGETPTVNNYLIIASGQTLFYDADGAEISAPSVGDSLYGQDASYLIGEEMSYQNNDDGTITDLNSGLMWEGIPTSESFTWQEASDYCDSLVLGEYDDWRLPNLKELFSISDFGKGWPYLDTTYFKLATGIVDKSEQFWSSNLYVGSTVEGQENAAFGVNHVTGHIKAYPSGVGMNDGLPADTSGTGTPPPPGGDGSTPPPGGDTDIGSPLAKHVRAVRGDEYGINEFVENSDSTISDNSTGLMWSQNDDGNGMDWQNALVYAENANLAGYTDWRLPNVKELQSIVDYSYAPGASDAANEGPAINPIFTCTPIVNEAGSSDYGYYWTGTSADFRSGEPYYYAWYVAFGRAVNGEGLDYHGAGAVRFDTKYEGGPLGEGGERYDNFVFLVRNI